MTQQQFLVRRFHKHHVSVDLCTFRHCRSAVVMLYYHPLAFLPEARIGGAPPPGSCASGPPPMLTKHYRHQTRLQFPPCNTLRLPRSPRRGRIRVDVSLGDQCVFIDSQPSRAPSSGPSARAMPMAMEWPWTRARARARGTLYMLSKSVVLSSPSAHLT